MENRSSYSNKMIEYPNFKGVIVITFAFFTIFLGYTSAGNIATKALKDNGYSNMGYYSFSAVYFLYAISSVFMNNVLKVITPKTSMLLGLTMYVVWGLALSLTVLTFQSEYYK